MKVIYYEDLENYDDSCNRNDMEKLKAYGFMEV